MAKNELINAVKLARAQLKSGRVVSTLGFAIVIAFFFVTETSTAIYGIFQKSEGIDYFQLTDNSFFWIFGMGIAYVVFNCLYRQSNRNFSVYPQTNNSRFLCFQLMTHLWIIVVPLTLMVVYLLQYGILSLIANGNSNIHLVYNFDITFVLAGLVVMIIYMALLAGIVSLVSALLRKFKLYAAAFFSAIIVLGISNLTIAINVFKKLFGFVMFESSFWMFALHGVIFWAALFAATLVINRFTVYYKTRSFKLKSERFEVIVAISVGAIIALGIIAITILAMRAGEPDDAATNTQEVSNDYFDFMEDVYNRSYGELKFDISHLPAGSNIDIEVSGDVVLVPNADRIVGYGSGGEYQSYWFEDGTELKFSQSQMTIMLDGELENIQGDTLIVTYSYPWQIIDNVEIAHLMNAEFEARLEGNTLYIHYTYDKNVKAVFVSMWSFMWQFDYFKGKGLFSDSIFSWSSSSSANVNIFIINSEDNGDGPPVPPSVIS